MIEDSHLPLLAHFLRKYLGWLNSPKCPSKRVVETAKRERAEAGKHTAKFNAEVACLRTVARGVRS